MLYEAPPVCSFREKVKKSNNLVNICTKYVFDILTISINYDGQMHKSLA